LRKEAIDHGAGTARTGPEHIAHSPHGCESCRKGMKIKKMSPKCYTKIPGGCSVSADSFQSEEPVITLTPTGFR
jgi:hypothetical protein